MFVITCAAIVASTPIIPSPPPAYDHRKQLVRRSVALVQQTYPQLQDLAESGTLIAVPRPENYQERRSDGYKEPELVLLVGTAHLSLQSAEDVRRVVLATKPQNVVVELCKSRSAQLYQQQEEKEHNISETTPSSKNNKSIGNNAFSLSGGNLLESFQRTIALGGRSALLLRVLLGNLSSKLSAEVGINSGAEFFAAREAAEQIGAQIVLGDRPIEVTLRRAWEALPRASRWKLFLELLEGVRDAQATGGALAAAQAVEQLKDDDAVSYMLSSLANKYPEALPPLVHERDLYMAWSLKRSKAVNGTNTVVGVLGKGHMRGVCYALMHDSENLRFRDVAGSKGKKSKGDVTKTVIQFAAETAVVSAAIYAWSQYSSSSSIP
ncbi:hypothetical protein NADE_004113 [Nannochloris sp. 'desiccata']|nr:hypothetical protein NADE_004113 [Chlorella desiccata (nom. nud.)]